MTTPPVRTRFAPSPTGDLHLGNVRTALFNWLFARQHAGAFVLRSEDTDRDRASAGALVRIEEDLSWLGMTPDEGPTAGGPQAPYSQYQRRERHDRLLHFLLERDLAYPCYCTREELAASRKRQLAAGQAPRYPGTCAQLGADERAARAQAGRTATVRFRVADHGEITFDDLVHGRQRFRLRDIGDFVIARGDGTPAFFFANAVDDADMHISHVLRGDDHLTNTPRQLLLLAALDLPVPRYGHFGLITDTDGQPLSKRTGAATVAELRARGYRPDAVRNHLARIGVSGLGRDLLPDAELVGAFDLARVSRGPAAHDATALDGWQRQALDRLDGDSLLDWLGQAWSEGAGPWPDHASGVAFAHAVLPNILHPQEAVPWAERVFVDPLQPEPEARQEIVRAGADFFTVAAGIDAPSPSQDFRGWATRVGAATGTRGRSLFRPLRAAISGVLSGPELAAIAPLIGHERLLARLRGAAAIAQGAETGDGPGDGAA